MAYNSSLTGAQLENAALGVINKNSVPFAYGGVVDVSDVVEDGSGCLQYAEVVDYNPVLGIAVLRLHLADNDNDRKFAVRQGSASGTVLVYAASYDTSYTYESNVYVTVSATLADGDFTFSVTDKYYITSESSTARPTSIDDGEEIAIEGDTSVSTEENVSGGIITGQEGKSVLNGK